jgi:predicted small secreted protein
MSDTSLPRRPVIRPWASARSQAVALLAWFMLSAMILPLGACNTTAGAGKDISAAGEAVTDTAESVKKKM